MASGVLVPLLQLADFSAAVRQRGAQRQHSQTLQEWRLPRRG